MRQSKTSAQQSECRDELMPKDPRCDGVPTQCEHTLRKEQKQNNSYIPFQSGHKTIYEPNFNRLILYSTVRSACYVSLSVVRVVFHTSGHTAIQTVLNKYRPTGSVAMLAALDSPLA